MVVRADSHTGYGIFDTQEPDEVFTEVNEALAYTETLNAQPEFLGCKINYKVKTLYDRIINIKDACKDEGADSCQESQKRNYDY